MLLVYKILKIKYNSNDRSNLNGMFGLGKKIGGKLYDFINWLVEKKMKE